MTDSPLKGETLMAYLKNHFDGAPTISSKQFRDFIGFSMSTDVRMRKMGLYPRVMRMPGGQKNARIFLQDVAAWIEQGGCQIVEQQKEYTGKRRGRPVGSKNKRNESAEPVSAAESMPAFAM